MKLLLDTHIAVWLSSNPGGLRPSQLAALQNPENTLYISAVSAWEIGTKVAKGQLELKKPLPALMRKYEIAELPITIAHAQEATLLPRYHRDPFDRMLIAQARLEGMALVTSDAEILRYPVTCI